MECIQFCLEKFAEKKTELDPELYNLLIDTLSQATEEIYDQKDTIESSGCCGVESDNCCRLHPYWCENQDIEIVEE
jgi:hypothetical protein